MKQCVYYLILMFVLMPSCVTQRRCSEKFPPLVIIRDSVVIKTTEKYHDTLIAVAGDSVKGYVDLFKSVNSGLNSNREIMQWLYGVKIDTIFKSISGESKARLIVNSGTITVDCKTDSLHRLIKNLRTVLFETQKFHNEVKLETRTDIKFKTPQWCWYLIVSNILIIVWKLKNPIGRLIQFFI